MCERIGCTHFPDLSKMNFGGAVAPSRRGFLKGAAAVSTIALNGTVQHTRSIAAWQ